MREIEILVELFTEVEAAKRSLSQLKFMGSKQTIDTYYYDPLRNNLQLNASGKLLECCRLRTKNGVHTMAYKTDIYLEAVWQYSEEHETKVDDISIMKIIIEKLGLKELVKISNVKHTYTADKFEIVLEEVDLLGNFLEVEYSEDDESLSVDQIKMSIANFIASLNLSVGQELNSGKPELLLLKGLNSRP